MLKSFLCSAAVLMSSASLAVADEKKVESKAEDKPTAGPAAFIPRELQGTPVAKRLTEIQAELNAAYAKRGPARQEADKARHAAHEAQIKADQIQQTINSLEQEKTRITSNGIAQSKEAAMQKAAFENSQKISRLEMQVRDLTARLEANTMARVQPASIQQAKDHPAPHKKAEHDKKAEPAKKAEPEKKPEAVKK